MTKIKIAIVSSIAILTGCMSNAQRLQGYSTGHVPCRADDIAIRDDESTLDGRDTWTAVCDGLPYFCSRTGSALDDSAPIACSARP